MSYPFRPPATWGEVFNVFTKNGVTLRTVPRVSFTIDQGNTALCSVFTKGTVNVGLGLISSATSGTTRLSWSRVRGWASQFNIKPEDFGFTAGWPEIYE